MKKQIRRSIFLLFAAPIFFLGCQKSEITDEVKNTNPNPNSEGSESLKSTITYCGTPLNANLVDFEETIIAGTAVIGNDETKLYVSYELTGDWWIQNAVLFAGPADSAGLIHPDGSGQFAPWYWNPPYRHDFFPWDFTQTHTYEVDLSTLDNCFTVVAYIYSKNLVTGEHKYIWGKSVSKVSGYYLEYCKQNCTPPPPPPPLGGCETGYAYGESYATCFLNIPGVNSNNWGWSNGQIGAGNYTWPIYAGAGQCNIDNGILVGYLQVNYAPPSATVTYSMLDGYIMNVTHLYVGTQILPKKKNKYTTAPGQFPYKHCNLNGTSSDTFTINGLSGLIYVVAHTEVCDDI